MAHRRLSRRRFLELLSGLGTIVACDDSEEARAPVPTTCSDPLGGWTRVGDRPFVEPTGPLDVPTGQGLSGRLFTDLSRVAIGEGVTSNERYYIRTRASPLLPAASGWRVALRGLIANEREYSVEELLQIAGSVVRGPFIMECSGNGAFAGFGMLSSATWSGASLPKLLERHPSTTNGTRVLVSGFDEHVGDPGNSVQGASWIFRREELEGAILATHMNDAPLPLDHGAPIRLMVPNWYGCASIKWVDRIELVPGDAPATAHMMEFAARTHQDGVPALARDYLPAEIDLAAVPIRVEVWRRANDTVLRVVGIVWGGGDRSPDLRLEAVSSTGSIERVSPDICTTPGAAFTVFVATLRPRARGRHDLYLRNADRSVRTRRLDAGFYRRAIDVG